MSSTASAVQVVEFVRAMALTWKNVSAYPPGHPTLVKSLDQAGRALHELRGPAGELSLGIAPDGLLYGPQKIEIAAAQKFAEALYTRGVAVVRFSSETNLRDVESFLRVLSSGTRADGKRSLGEELTSAGVVNINVESVYYGAVQLTDTLSAEPPQPESGSVWEDIVRSLLENRGFAERARSLPSIETADEFSRLIAESLDAEKTHPVEPDGTFGVRLPISGRETPVHRFLEHTVGQRISEAHGLKKQHALEQAVQIIRTLPAALRTAVLRAVVRALATDDGAAMFLQEFAAELPHDEVLEALRYLASMQTLSSHAMKLLESLAMTESAARAEAPSPSVVADLVRLFGDDDISRINPAEHDSLLSSIAVQVPHVPAEARVSLHQLGLRAENVDETMPQFRSTLFELLIDPGRSRPPDPVLARVESVFLAHLRSGEINEAMEVIAGLQSIAVTCGDPLRSAIDRTMTSLAVGDAMRTVIDHVHLAKPEIAAQIQRLTKILGTNAHRKLLIALAEENNRSRRRRLFDFIASLGQQIVPEAKPLLEDERWYVVRNMIALLRAVQDRSAAPELRQLARHPDLRVRQEAVKSLLAFDREVPADLLDDLFHDPDPKLAEMAVTMVGTAGIKEAVGPLLRILVGNDVMGANRGIRLKALRALGDIGDERALPQIDRFLKPTLLLGPAREERYAAWESLLKYPAAAAQPILERGARSNDPQIRAICTKLRRS